MPPEIEREGTGRSPVCAFCSGASVRNLSSTHLRYLYAIYEISQTSPDVRSVSVAERMRVSRPSVARMLGVLMDKKLIVKKLYGKIYLTDKGFPLAQSFGQKVNLLVKRLPLLGLSLTEEEIFEAACAMAAVLPERIGYRD